MSRHRQSRVRPRYARMGVAATSVTVTAIAVLGAVGVIPSASGGAAASADVVTSAYVGRAAAPPSAPARPSGREGGGTVGPGAAPTAGPGSAGGRPTTPSRGPVLPPPAEQVTPAPASTPVPAPGDVSLPADSGEGKRVVFSEARQRVWLVSADDSVERTYLVSGSVTDNLQPGTYHVYSRSEQAWGIDNSGTMKWFVRFTQGDNAAIGFHDIPVKDGHQLQTVRQLGTPQSHGCIRQREADALAMWAFAPIGTTVVVTV